ncbi:MAG: hypothetical protein Tsb0021_01490 [Chlamydiales bacterium]
MSFSITPDMIKDFKVGTCKQKHPCRHLCNITLCGGRKAENIPLDGDEIYALINAIADKEIINNADNCIKHFKNYKDFTGVCFSGEFYSRPIPEKILFDIFGSSSTSHLLL